MKKPMKAIAALEPTQYDGRLAELKRSLYDLRVKQAIGQLEKPSKLRDLRRDVARIETLRRRRALGQPVPAVPAPKAAAPAKKAAPADDKKTTKVTRKAAPKKAATAAAKK